jgi:biotin carboxylase
MIAKKIAIVIAGTNPHAELIQKLQKRHFHVLLIDQADNPPAKKYCDEYYQVSIFEKERILEIAKERNASLIISAAAERANAIACYVSEAMNLYVPYSYETAMKISDKVSMKTCMKEATIPTSNYVYINKYDDLHLINELNFPMVIKPADGYGSRGIRIYYTKTELEEDLKTNSTLNSSKYLIIEEYLEGREFGVYCFLGMDKPKIIFVNEKIKRKKSNELPALGTISRPNLDQNLIKSFEDIASKIMKYFCLKNTPLLIQLIVTKNGVKLLEFTPRLGGGVSFKTVKLQTGFDFLEASIDSFLGLHHEQPYEKGAHIIIDSGIYSKPGLFSEIFGYEELISDKVIEDIIIYKTNGMPIGIDFSSSSRAAAFIIKANDEQDMLNKINRAYKEIQIQGTNGESLLLEDFHISEIDVQ